MIWKLECLCQTLLNNHVVRTQAFQTTILLQLTLLVYLPPWLRITMPKPKREESASFPNIERQKLKSLYNQGGAASGSVRNTSTTSKLSFSKVRQFLHSKPTHTKFNLAKCKSKRMEAFARFKNETCSVDLAYVEKLAEDNNSVKHILARQILFDRTVVANEWKHKTCKKLLGRFQLGW